MFANVTRKGFYTVTATVLTSPDSASITRRIRLDPDPMACSAHLVNTGLTFREGGVVTAEFVGVGPVESFLCTLDGVVLSNPCECV